MFSERIKDALEQDVVGQPYAIQCVVRGVTRLVSGLTPRERSWCAYLFMGPPGTGRAHLVRTLAGTLHGEEAMFTLNCNPGAHADPWAWFVHQLTPLFASRAMEPPVAGRRPPALILIQDLECARKEIYPMLARVLETGEVALAGGRRGRLDNCLVFLTTGLCTREILDETSRMGFPGGTSPDDEGERPDTIIHACRTEAENVFGLDLLAQLDNIVVFRRLEEENLANVLDRHFARMSRWLAQRGVRCELLPAARAFLLERGSRQAMLGARDLVLTHRREVEFPVADLLVSGRLEAGSRVVVDRLSDDGHLHFTVEGPEECPADTSRSGRFRSVPVTV